MLVRRYYDVSGQGIRPGRGGNSNAPQRGRSSIYFNKMLKEPSMGVAVNKNKYYNGYVDPILGGSKNWDATTKGGNWGSKQGGASSLDTFGLSDSDVSSLASTVSQSKQYFTSKGTSPFKALDQALYNKLVVGGLEYAEKTHRENPSSFTNNLKASAVATGSGLAYGFISMFNPYTWIQGARSLKELATSSGARRSFLQSIDIRSHPITAAANLGSIVGGFAAGEAVAPVFRPGRSIVPDYASLEEAPRFSVRLEKPIIEEAETANGAVVQRTTGSSWMVFEKGLDSVDTYKPFYRRGTGGVAPDYAEATVRNAGGDKWVRVFREKGATVKAKAPEFKEGTWRFRYNDYDVIVEQRIRNKLLGPSEFERRIIALDKGRGKAYGLGERVRLRFEKGAGYVYERSGYEFDPTLEELTVKPLQPSGEPPRFPGDVYDVVSRRYGVPSVNPPRPLVPGLVVPPFTHVLPRYKVFGRSIDRGVSSEARGGRGIQGGGNSRLPWIRWHPPDYALADTGAEHPGSRVSYTSYPLPQPPRPPLPPVVIPQDTDTVQDTGGGNGNEDYTGETTVISPVEANTAGETAIAPMGTPPFEGRGYPQSIPPARGLPGRMPYRWRRKRRRLKYWEIDYGDVGIPFVTGF